ncbi:DNA polymerase interacting tetratricopeptide repeat-containing, protein of 47 kDa [Frankliniella fusca]|uniref:DNA polymerase interacting tetratricopeptide repeat-containing, protein of 47 kDa n=1 Tax=Frankliniella fusca TaxID=407009 RepID=A0AAE1HHE3_9NEOP|nr:DNA polymerase interacting tetratricopeptide repeat-containing, protein of 47 kDa [Frankliniella fusca]
MSADEEQPIPSKGYSMTDEERAELAAKLDADLDAFINGLEKKSYTEGWPEDRWQEEMEKHPFFMTKAPEPGEELSPLMQGIQQLKYDETENTPEELAKAYKDDGNFNFKCKKYRHAIIAYTEGLKKKCNDDDINAQLYNNRAASNFFLKNYRSCLNDCLAALKLKKDYPKALHRAAECLYHLNKFDECIQYCDKILSSEQENKTFLDLRSKALLAKKAAERDRRKQMAAEKKEEKRGNELLEAVRARKIKFKGKDSSALKLSDLEPQFPDAMRSHVTIDESGKLVWPVIFMYPEYKLTDFIQSFHEDETFENMFAEVFNEHPEWDAEKKYTAQGVRVYFEDENERVHNIPNQWTLGKALTHKKYTLQGGTPGFMILVSGSEAEKTYVK